MKDKKNKNDIAITGIAFNIPNSDNLDDLWDNLKNGRDCLGHFEEERKNDVKKYLEFSKRDIKL